MPVQMTLDRVLFEVYHPQAAGPVLRFFYASEPSVTVGYAAEKKSGYALEASRHELDGLPVCRRMTGGGTVIHGQDLIFSLFAHKQDCPGKFDSVETSYRHLHEVVKLAFAKLGKTPAFYQKEEAQNGRDCFLNPVETDLRLDGRKIAGGAQKRSEDFFLHEESIQPPSGMVLAELECALLLAFEEYFEIKIERAVIDPQILIRAEKEAEACVLPALAQNK